MSNRIGVKIVFGTTGEHDLGYEPDWGKAAFARRRKRLLSKEPQDTCHTRHMSNRIGVKVVVGTAGEQNLG